MKKLLFFLSTFLLNLSLQAQNCPTYASVDISPNEACGDQVYYLEIANNTCPGTITFNVSGNYGSFGYEIDWEITSNLTSNIVASGFGATNGTINTTVNIDPNIQG